MKRQMQNFTLAMLVSLIAMSCFAQDATQEGALADLTDGDATRTVIVMPGDKKPLAFLYAASAEANVVAGTEAIEQTIELTVRVVQGKGNQVRLGLRGTGEVIEVSGEGVVSWAVRKAGDDRFLELQLTESDADRRATVKMRTQLDSLPSEIEMLHLSPGDALGFNSMLRIEYAQELSGQLVMAEGFAPLVSDGQVDRLQTSTGGRLRLRLDRKTALPPPIELQDTQLVGKLHPNGKSVSFSVNSTATVTEADARVTILSGSVALSELPQSEDYRLELKSTGDVPTYELVFAKAGSFPIALQFVAPLTAPRANWQGLDFKIASSAVVPFRLDGFESDLEFASESQMIVPSRGQDAWRGFLPASGHVRLEWKNASGAVEGKLFFATSARVEATVGPGLLREEHTVEYQLLQGQLPSLSLIVRGPGEILDVEGEHIVGWKVVADGEQQRLEVTLSQPLRGSSQIRVRSQTPLGAFPVRVEGLTLEPEGSIRHSGYLRVSNSGSVSVEPTALSGLTQLAPEQFPGEAIAARQLFVYRFPTTDYAFTIVADRIQPEVSVTQLVVYQLSESDRVIEADLELDIREAAIREWNVSVPDDYSIVSLTGASVADYVAASDAESGLRNITILFGQDVQGRQLVSLRMEKSEVAAAGDWALPRLEFPDAKAVRGDIGIVASPGYRIAVNETDLLVEKPLSYFPKPVANLQQAYRIRELGWSATMRIEVLERSVQSDVFHLYSLSQGSVYGSALVNYFITGAPTAELELNVPAALGNVTVDGQDVRNWRREGDKLTVALHQPVMGAYTLLITFEEKPSETDGAFQAGVIAPLGVQGDRGYVEVVSPVQVEIEPLLVSPQLLVLDALELPAEFRLLSTAPALGTWQYTERPFDLKLKVNWFEPGTTAAQVVEFSEANSRVSPDGELVTDVVYYVKSRGQRALRLELPGDPVRLWSAAVNGQPVTAREAGTETLIPLPGGADPNVAVEVSLRLGKPAVDNSQVELMLPTVLAPVLKTQWNLQGDENHVLLSQSGTVQPANPVPWPTGFEWLARHGLIALVAVAVLVLLSSKTAFASGPMRIVGLVAAAAAAFVAGQTAWAAYASRGVPEPLQLSLPVLAAGETVQLSVANMPSWLMAISWVGLGLTLGGSVLFSISLMIRMGAAKGFVRLIALGLLAVGILLHLNGAIWFFGCLALAILTLLLVPALVRAYREGIEAWKARSAIRAEATESPNSDGTASGVATVVLFFLTLGGMLMGDNEASASEAASLHAANALSQQWQISSGGGRLVAEAKVTLSGKPGDQFLLLRAPAILTEFDGDDLRLSKIEDPQLGLIYVVTIPIVKLEAEELEAEEPVDEPKKRESDWQVREYSASFKYQLEGVQPMQGIEVPTGTAAMHQIDLRFDESGREVLCTSAALIEIDQGNAMQSQAKILLGPNAARIVLKPRSRDLAMEETQFFIEGQQVYSAGPGVIDGRHRFNVRTSQGRVQTLRIKVPEGLTVSAVNGPIGAWQFDADNRVLQVEVDAAAESDFVLTIDTQRGLDTLPTSIDLAPLRVEEAGGEVGLLAVAFGSEAQPEKVDANGMSQVNLGDFDAGLLTDSKSTLHRVYRYGVDEGGLKVQVAPVAPEVRSVSRQVLSLGDERVVLSINFAASITRAGLFQLSFPLPDGYEVESLSGESLHHWSELTEEDGRQIVLHLKGKTMGNQNFALTLAGNAPTDAGEWALPRFELNEANRQSGDLVVQPITGIRLRTNSRQNVAESDPRAMGGQAQGALAFNLLQRDWSLTLGIEKLDAWLTGQVLHEVTLREGQTRSTVYADFNVENASIRELTVVLPITNENEIKTVRANGEVVSDFVRTAPDSNTWTLRFQRRMIGRIQFQIEFERRGERVGDGETLSPIAFPEASQLGYYFAVRVGGRLEVESVGNLTQGWQANEWNAVPQSLREAGNRNAPALVLRAMSPTTPLPLRVIRHSLADALKLRVDSGTLTTILSPTGDQLTSVEVTMEVIQRSSLQVQLPEGGDLFSIFVNGESVHSVRQTDNSNTWQFTILPGIDDRTAQVKFVYSLKGDGLQELQLVSPQLNVPLENVQWNVLAPNGFELLDNDGNLELIGQEIRDNYDRKSYLSKATGKRQMQAKQATELLEQANQLLQAGEQKKARWALNNVANSYALDAASNEDARVQLENLQTQQAIVGLNTRRQRLYLDNQLGSAPDPANGQLREAASNNPVLQQEQLNFRPQELSQLLAGNSREDNSVLQRIASRLVQHQRTTEPAPQAIVISLPEEGTVYSFSRAVQVSENAPLKLDLRFKSEYQLRPWQWALLGVALFALAGALSRGWRRPG